MSKINISVGSNAGTLSVGDHNQFNISYATERHKELLSQFEPLLAELQRVQPAEQQRLRAALDSLKPGAAPNSDARVLEQVERAPEPERKARVLEWLKKIAPAAAGLAGNLLNPAVGALAAALATWVTEKVKSGTA